MALKIDYYEILGVLPTAEDIVIRAAYKALAQRYHPDRFNGSIEESTRRMAEINEAYSTLSDPKKRQEYDKSRVSKDQTDSSYFGDVKDDIPPSYDPLEKDWTTAIAFYEDLTEIESRLSKISWRLGYSFKAYILETKLFKTRRHVADSMENQFLAIYFGDNKEIIAFARRLIMDGKKSEARSLNNAIRVLGSNVDPRMVIDKITNDWDLYQKSKEGAATPEDSQGTIYICSSCRAYNSIPGKCSRCGNLLGQKSI